jgi:hypothetical protein
LGTTGFATVWRLLAAAAGISGAQCRHQRFGKGSSEFLKALFLEALRLPAADHPDLLGSWRSYSGALRDTRASPQALLAKMFQALNYTQAVASCTQ